MTTSAQRQAASELASMDYHAWFDIADKFSCNEAEMVAEFLRQWANAEMADEFLEHHAFGDEEGDLHYVES